MDGIRNFIFLRFGEKIIAKLQKKKKNESPF